VPKVVKSNIDPRQYDRYQTTDVVQKCPCCSCAPGTDTLIVLTHNTQSADHLFDATTRHRRVSRGSATLRRVGEHVPPQL